MNDHINKTREYSDISEYLGDKNNRYLSTGYKRVSRELKCIDIDRENCSVSMRARLSYDKTWSIKLGEYRDDIHLSTFDVAIFVVKACEVVLDKICGLSDLLIHRSWVRFIDMKLGCESFLDLDNIPIQAIFTGSESRVNSISGTISTFSVTVGNAKAVVEIDHPLAENELLTDTDFFSLDLESNCLGCNYHKKDLDIVNLKYDHNEHAVDAEIHIKLDDDYSSVLGIGKAYSTAFNIFDTIIISAQLGQFLVYSHDDIDRDKSNNLWLRSLVSELEKPVYSLGANNVTVKVLKSRHIKRRGEVWSVVEPILEFQDNHGYIRGDFVHLLPQQEEK